MVLSIFVQSFFFFLFKQQQIKHSYMMLSVSPALSGHILKMVGLDDKRLPLSDKSIYGALSLCMQC